MRLYAYRGALPRKIQTGHSCFGEIIKHKHLAFEKRSRRAPGNAMNALIGFGSSFLYDYIAAAINNTSLDIRIGYLHSTNRRAESPIPETADDHKPHTFDFRERIENEAYNHHHQTEGKADHAVCAF